MNHRRTAAALTGAAALLALTGCAKSYDEQVQDCYKAVVAQTDDQRGKPAACEPISEDDYAVIVGHVAMDELGWLDDDGNFDESKLIESTP